MSQSWQGPEQPPERVPRHAADPIGPPPVGPPVMPPGGPQPAGQPYPPPTGYGPPPAAPPQPYPSQPYGPPDAGGYAPRVPQLDPARGTGAARSDWRGSARRGLSQITGLHASRDVREYLELHRTLTTAVTSGRRIVVLSIEPAQGSTTAAALLATALATRRADPVLLVDAAAISPNPLHRVFQAEPVQTIRSLAEHRPEVTSRAGFDRQLTPVGRDVWLLPGDDIVGRSGLHPPDAATYSAAVTPFGRYFDLTITDLGCAPGYGTAELLLDRAHALCLITSATRAGFDAVTSRLRQLRDNMGAPWAGRTLVVANRTRPGRAARWSGHETLRGRSGGVPVVPLAFDANLGPGFPGRLAELTPETHLAAMRLAAGVVDTAVPGSAPAALSGVPR